MADRQITAGRNSTLEKIKQTATIAWKNCTSVPLTANHVYGSGQLMPHFSWTFYFQPWEERSRRMRGTTRLRVVSAKYSRFNNPFEKEIQRCDKPFQSFVFKGS